MIDLGAPDGWFQITGRGTAASFAKGRVPDEVKCPRELLNQEVDIDGTAYMVKGVEHFAVQCGGCDGPFALLVATP